MHGSTTDRASGRRRGVATGLIAAAAFALIALMTFRGPGPAIDASVLRWSRTHRPGWALPCDLRLMRLGSPVLMPVALMAVAAVVAWRRRSWAEVLSTVTLLVVLAVGVVFAKNLFARPGPGGRNPAPVGPDSPWAFPSGHATTALVTWTAGARLILGTRWPRRGRAAVTVVGLVVSVALVTGGIHWLTDVLAAWPFAVLIAQCSVAVDASVRGILRAAWRGDSVRTSAVVRL